MHSVSCTNTHPDITDFVNQGIIKNTRTWISRQGKVPYYKIKRFLICASDDTFWEVIVLWQR